MRADGVEEVWMWRGEKHRKLLGVSVLSNVLFAASIISGLGLGTLRSPSLCLTQTHMNTFTYVAVEQASGTIITRTPAHVFLSSIRNWVV